MTIPAAILLSNTSPASYPVGGLPLLARHIKELHKLGVTEFYLIGLTEVPQAVLHSRLPADAVLHAVACSREETPRRLQALPSAQHDMLLLQGNWLIDPRLLAVLLADPQPQWLPAPGNTAARYPIAARLSPTSLNTWSTVGLDQWLQDSRVLEPDTLNTYSSSYRGPVPFYILPIETPEDAATATKTLIHTAGKHTLDVVAGMLDSLLVNRLVCWLCSTRITPNQVTLATGVLGTMVSLLFLHGWLRLGSLLTYAAVTLDGVDGKLARTTLQTSRLGELEHVLDFFMEQSWYLTITIFLVSHTGMWELWWIGGSLMACDLLDKLLHGVGRLYLGKQPEELGQFDRKFRRIGGRRNIYALMFLFGFWSGFPVHALVLALVWALLTVAVHSSRLVYHLGRRTATA
jgi:phosphatidylglycerophosphate synthase